MTARAKKTTVTKARQATTPAQDEVPATKPERKLLAQCPEFSCYEVPSDEPEEPGMPTPPPYQLIEATPKINEAMLKADMRITDAGDESTKGERLRLAETLRTLAEFTAGHGTDEKALLSDLSATLGKMVLSVMETPTKTRRVSPERKREVAYLSEDPEKPADVCHSPRDTFKSAEVAAVALGAKVGGAVTSIARWKFTPQGWNRIRAIIFEAKSIFRETLTRPTKFQIRLTLEDDGYLLTGNDANERWEDAFQNAGLGKLPK